MKRQLIRTVAWLLGCSVVGLGLWVLRGNLLDEGARALKEDDGARALQRLKPLAYLGDTIAQTIVASIYAYGWGGVAKSDEDAIYWFHRCGPLPNTVDDGADPAASQELLVAKDYATGTEGMAADPVESLKWLKLAARGGSKEARAMLAQRSRQAAEPPSSADEAHQH